jgi:hypothetical protein
MWVCLFLQSHFIIQCEIIKLDFTTYSSLILNAVTKPVIMDTNERVQSILSDMVTKNQVRVLSIDFDATIIQVHTYGAWRGTAEELSQHVRPVFVSLLKQALALQDYGLYVSVVTFSSQAKLIRKVLSLVLECEELAKQMLIRCNDFKWDWPRGFQQAGKQGEES